MALTTVPSAMFQAGQTPAFNGIAFPATQSASADANTLDDYEEGTWTPSIVSLNGFSGALTVDKATYTKIGRVVFIEMNIYFGSASGNVTVGDKAIISGLPFTSNGSFYPAGRIANSDDNGGIMETNIGQGGTNIRNTVHSVRNAFGRSVSYVSVLGHYNIS